MNPRKRRIEVSAECLRLEVKRQSPELPQNVNEDEGKSPFSKLPMFAVVVATLNREVLFQTNVEFAINLPRSCQFRLIQP